jgi:hypothetical protein
VPAAEITAWAKGTGVVFTHFEFRALRRMDLAFIEFVANRSDEESG